MKRPRLDVEQCADLDEYINYALDSTKYIDHLEKENQDLREANNNLKQVLGYPEEIV